MSEKPNDAVVVSGRTAFGAEARAPLIRMCDENARMDKDERCIRAADPNRRGTPNMGMMIKCICAVTGVKKGLDFKLGERSGADPCEKSLGQARRGAAQLNKRQAVTRGEE